MIVTDSTKIKSGADPGILVGGMASAGARAYMGVWRLCPQWGPEATPLVRGSGGFAPRS